MNDRPTDRPDNKPTCRAALLPRREETNQQHRLKGVSVKPLRTPHLPEKLPGRVLIVPAAIDCDSQTKMSPKQMPLELKCDKKRSIEDKMPQNKRF